MNHPDRPHGPLPLPRPAEIVPAPGHAYDIDAAGFDMPPAAKKITLRLVGRAVRRHWWQAALLWTVGSAGLMALVYFKVKPTFVAFSQVRVEPGGKGIFDQHTEGNFEQYKETQVNIITQPTVIDAALSAHPELLRYPQISEAEDVVAEIRSLLSVSVRKNTNLIDISTATPSADESALIVNAVVEAYVKGALDANGTENQQRIDQLKEARFEKEREVTQKRNSIKDQQEKTGLADLTEVKSRNTVTIEEYRQLSNELLRVQIEIVKAEAQFAQLQNEQPTPTAGDAGSSTASDASELFYSDPKVAAVRDKLDRAASRFSEVKKKVRDPLDPSLTRPMDEKRAAKAELDALWKKMRPGIEAQIRRGDVHPSGPDASLRTAEAQLTALKAQEASLNDRLSTLNVKQRAEGASAIAMEFDRMDLTRATQYLDTIDRNLAEIEYQSKNPVAKIRREFPAKPSPKGTNNRLKIMAVAPVGVLFGVLGLMVLLELHAGRVVDPEELTARVRVPVVGVVPPLPQVRPQTGLFSGRDEFRAQRQLDQFVQSLDHLRVALCSGRDAWGRERRCILITSAVGSEGKTTLAAQLAERCVNAGLHTLLIDGDLRNPTLSRMLDVPNARGLINVLRGEALPDEAISVVGGAGGFHFMPAGTPKVDPSRLLHGDRLGKLLAQAREGFDIVIVDAPPVLPVPDALTIGRWTDGAVLAVRCDASRFNLVEKANRRLATVGVTVIGAVVNGVRVAESTYGSYYPSYADADDRSAPLDV